MSHVVSHGNGALRDEAIRHIFIDQSDGRAGVQFDFQLQWPCRDGNMSNVHKKQSEYSDNRVLYTKNNTKHTTNSLLATNYTTLMYTVQLEVNSTAAMVE